MMMTILFILKRFFFFYLFLDEIEGHGDDGETEEEVENARHQLVLALFQHFAAGHQITKANGRQCDETEIGAVQKRPLFPRTKHNRTQTCRVEMNAVIIRMHNQFQLLIIVLFFNNKMMNVQM